MGLLSTCTHIGSRTRSVQRTSRSSAILTAAHDPFGVSKPAGPYMDA
jgi:hypothetical protein